jgi:hypothetical protein
MKGINMGYTVKPTTGNVTNRKWVHEHLWTGVLATERLGLINKSQIDYWYVLASVTEYFSVRTCNTAVLFHTCKWDDGSCWPTSQSFPLEDSGIMVVRSLSHGPSDLVWSYAIPWQSGPQLCGTQVLSEHDWKEYSGHFQFYVCASFSH